MAPGFFPAFTCSIIFRAASWPTRKAALQVHAQHAVEIGLLQIEKIGAVNDAGIVHENIDVAAEGLAGLGDQVRRVLRLAHVAAHEARRVSETLARRHTLALVDIGEHDLERPRQ